MPYDAKTSGASIGSIASGKFPEYVPIEAAFLLVYAADGVGRILKINALGANTSISASGKQFMADSLPQESARYIKAHGKDGRCDFCTYDNGKPKYKKVLPLENLMPVIMKVVNRDYGQALIDVPWDDENKEYIGTVFDPWDFVVDQLNSYMGCEDNKLILEIQNILAFEDRYSRYDIIRRQEEIDMETWNKYCGFVNSSSLTTEQIISECYRSRASEKLQAIRGCLEMVYDHIQTLHLISTITTGVAIYRCGTHISENYKSQYDTPVIPVSVLGTAPPMVTNNNRMSEKGDMMFYGAFDEEAALKEIEAASGDFVTTGIFHTNKRFKVLDLGTLRFSQRPSIFDVDQSDKRSNWSFLWEFMEEISKPVEHKPDDYGKNEYKPTQVFTKFIQRKTDLGGIIYPSSKCGIHHDGYKIEGKRCVVLFVTNRDCIEEGDPVDTTRKQLIMKSDPRQRTL